MKSSASSSPEVAPTPSQTPDQQAARDWLLVEANLGNLSLEPEEMAELQSKPPGQWSPSLRAKIEPINAELPPELRLL
jgi:hypothetical protein